MTRFLSFCLVLSAGLSATARSGEFIRSGKPAEFLNARYPNWLITSDYGIVTADDLAYDEKLRLSAEPYDPNKYSNQRHWQCVPLKNVKPRYRIWRGEDGMGLSGVIVSLCDLEIQIRSPNGLQIYHDRRGHPVEFCNAFKRNWKRLTRREEIVCLEGEGSSNYTDEADGHYRLWAWDKLKTRKGCYAYFEGECNVSGCAKGKCPE